MARQIRTARGDIVDFDEILIKQQLAEAPMNIEVARRKNFIDSKETIGRQRKVPAISNNGIDNNNFISNDLIRNIVIEQPKTTSADFENTNEGIDSSTKQVIEPIPNLPVRKK